MLRILLLSLFLISFNAHALVAWRGSHDGQPYATYQEACDPTLNYYIANPSSYSMYAPKEYHQDTVDQWSCGLHAGSPSGAIQYVAITQAMLISSCPSGTQPNANNTFCEYPNVCPDNGTPVEIWIEDIIIFAGSGATTEASNNDCEISLTERKDCTFVESTDTLACKYAGTYTGNEASSGQTVGQETVISTGTPNNDDTLTDTKTETTAPTVITNNPDGSVTTEQTSVTTETVNQGVQMWEENGTIYIRDQDGTVTTTQTTTTETTNSDGTKQQVIQLDWTKQPDSPATVVLPQTGTLSVIESVPQPATTGTITTTKTFDSTGNQISSNTTQTSGTNGQGGNGEEGDNAISSNFGDFETGEGSWWESSYPDGLSGIWQENMAQYENSNAQQWLNSWSFPSSGSLPTWSIDFSGLPVNLGSGDITPPEWIWSIIKAIMILTALFLARRLVFGG